MNIRIPLCNVRHLNGMLNVSILILYRQTNKSHYNIARMHPNLIPIGVIMVHFSTYARPCVHPMTCASQMGKHARAVLLKKLLQRDKTIKTYIYESLKFNETLRLNRYEKPFSPFFCTESFVINREQNLFSRNH